MIQVRCATNSDIDSIMSVVKSAQEYLKNQGINQWQDGYPNREAIETDVNTAEAYVLDDNGKIAGYFAIYTENEPVYDYLEGGEWLSDTRNHAAMHRVCISGNYRGQGLAHMIYTYATERAEALGRDSLRVDTHHDNKIMRHMAESHGFVACGSVYYPGNLKRIAFEKLLK